MNTPYIEDMNFSRTAEAVFYYLQDLDGEYPVTIDEISEDCAIYSRRETIAAIRRLECSGVLEREPAATGNYYIPRWPPLCRSTG